MKLIKTIALFSVILFYSVCLAKPYGKPHRIQASNPIGNGWHLAKSTEGNFSVKLPGKFNDVTLREKDKEGNESVTYLVGHPGKDNCGFAAMLFRGRGMDGVYKRFEKDLKKKNDMNVSTYKGHKTIYNRQIIKESGVKVGGGYSMRVRTDNGMYMLMVTYPINKESSILKKKELFFKSLDFKEESVNQ